MKTQLPVFLVLVSAIVASSVVGAEPVAVGDGTCLFLDDRFIAEQSGLKRVWHQGKPRPEVAIQATESWEKWPHLWGSVIRDPKDGLYKMYYESAIMPRREGPGRTTSFTCYICCAESKDGKTWTKPKLGLFDDLGSTANNIVVTDAEFAKVFIDPLETDPSKRLKMFAYIMRPYPYPDGGQGECLLSSGDGRHWKFESGFNKPGYAKPEQGDFTDSQTFLWDPVAQLYRAYVRTFAKSHVAEKKDGRRRAIGVTECRVLNKNWTPIAHVLEADAQDDAKAVPLGKDPAKAEWTELYSMPFFNYGNHYLGLLSILYFIDGSDFNGGGDLQLTFSHDAKQWHRHPERQTLIAPSNAAPELFPTYIQLSPPLELGDEMWMYYAEANGAHPIAPFEKAVSQIRAAVWRQDGFVSLDAEGKGNLTTQPLLFAGKQLRVNCEGAVTIACLDEHGTPLKKIKPQTLKGNSVSQSVAWDLSKHTGKPIRLRFDLEKGRLWSFRFAR